MHEVLHKCRANFGQSPRQFSFWDRFTYLNIPKPSWLRANPADDLMTLFTGLQTLYSGGIVVWGHTIQANRQLFEPGNNDHPGELVYSIDNQRDIDPAWLQEVAYALYQLKGTAPVDPAFQSIARYLANELVRVFGLPVPESISPFMRCRISTTLFVRKHLPMRRLCAPFLPIIVSRQKPWIALPLPERYWPQQLVDWWTGQ